MSPKLPKILHFVGRQVRGQWIVACLDFNLAAQDDTFEGAKSRILDQVNTYVETALSLDQGIHAEQLLNRKAPLSDWLWFYLVSTLLFFHSNLNLKQYQLPCPNLQGA